jgi:predicted transcriptional regulator of viral defense system
LQYHKVIEALSQDRFLRADKDFESSITISTRTRVFRVADIPDAPAEDIACLVDPFTYISHLSALNRYGLTSRQPKMLMIASPQAQIWSNLAREKMTFDYGFAPFGGEEPNFFRPLQHISIPSQLRNRMIDLHNVAKEYRIQPVVDGFSRIIEIGSLFAQTLDDQSHCGGINHVLEIWDEHAETYLESIISAVTQFQSPIVKVRAGYILAERLGITDPRIEAWKAFAQRGGSRRLDPSSPYAPTFSEEWKISINVGYVK